MITQHNQRVFFSDNGTLEDISLRMNDFRNGSFSVSYTANEDHIYVGSDLPFSNKYFCVDTVNAIPSNVKVEYWTGSKWQEAVDLLDGSDAAYNGVPFSKSGTISWKTDIEENCWGQEGDTEDIPELASLRIFCFYWMRFSFDANISAEFSYIGYDFARDDNAIYSLYPDLNNDDFKECFKAGKTDWREQRLQASENVINYLRGKEIIFSPSQLLDYEIYHQAAVHETARIIYGGLDTDAYSNDYVRAGERFGRAINMKKFNVDKNRTANLEHSEARDSVTFLSR